MSSCIAAFEGCIPASAFTYVSCIVPGSGQEADADSRTHSPRHRWHGNLLYNVRKRQTASGQVPGQQFADFAPLRGHGRRPLRSCILGMRTRSPVRYLLVKIAHACHRSTPSTRPKRTINATASQQLRTSRSRCLESSSIRHPCTEASVYQWRDPVSSTPFSFRASSFSRRKSMLFRTLWNDVVSEAAKGAIDGQQRI